LRGFARIGQARQRSIGLQHDLFLAQVLGIGETTVKNHISSILSKLSANDRAHAVTIAL
jgi:hypothetical protein